MATPPHRGPRLSAATDALTAPVDAAVDAATRRATLAQLTEEAETLSARPYMDRNRPVIQAQLNPRRRLHPEWPEEWYLHVPGTDITWRPKAAASAGYPRARVAAYPSEAAAEAAAQAAWRAYWTQTRHVALAPDSVISPAVWAEFTVRWGDDGDALALRAWAPADGLPPRVVIRTRDVPASVIGAPVARRGLDPDTAFPEPWDAAAQDARLSDADAAWRAHADHTGPTAGGDPWTHATAQQWVRSTHRVLRTAAALPDRTTALRIRAGVMDAVGAVYDKDDPKATVAGPRPFLRTVDQALALTHLIAPTLDGRMRQWAEDARALRSDDVGLFRAGTLPPEAVLDPDTPLAQALLDRSAVGVHRMPNGSLVLWQADESSAAAPWVSARLYPTLAAARDAADADGVMYLELHQHPPVESAWRALMAERYPDRVDALVARVLTPPARPLPMATPASAAAETSPVLDTFGTVHLSPWDPGHVIWWRESPQGTAHFGAWTTDGRWQDAPPDVVPPPTPAPQGFSAAMAAARPEHPDAAPADLAPYLARACARAGVFPTAAPANRDCLWHVADLGFAHAAVAWTRPWTPEAVRRTLSAHGLEPARPRVLGAGDTGHVVVLQDPDRLVRRLTETGAVALPASPVVPAEVARAWAASVQQQTWHQTGRRPRDPFAVVRQLAPPSQRALVESLAERLRPAAWAAVHNLPPRYTAELWEQPVHFVTDAYRRAESALAFVLDANRDRPVIARATPALTP